jgi:hypothetical protein
MSARARLGEGVRSTPFRLLCGGFLVSPCSTFPSSPPLIPDGRISRVRLAATAFSPHPFPNPAKLKRSPAYARPTSGYKCRFAARWLYCGSPALHPAAWPRHSHCPPRAPLRNRGVTALTPRSRPGSAGVTPLSSLILAHAPDRHPLSDFVPLYAKSLQVAASPCCMTAFPSVISVVLVWVLGPLPRRDLPVLPPVSSRETSASRYEVDVRLAKPILLRNFQQASVLGAAVIR